MVCDVRKSHFPNSRKSLCLGGCVVGKEKFVKRWECEYCTQAEMKWKKRFKESCEINNLDEVIFSGGAYAQGMQYLLDEDYLRAILSFHYTLSTFPNFHLNDKSNYWLMQIFLKLGNFHLANEYYLNSFEFNLNNENCGNIRDPIQIKILDSLGQHFKEVTEGSYKEASNEKLIENFHSQLDRIIDLITMPDTNEIQNVLSEFKVINSMIINEIKDSSLFYEELISKTCESCKELYSPLWKK